MKWPPAHEEAREEFSEAVAYLRDKVSKHLAKRFTLRAMDTVRRARRFPESGPPIGRYARRMQIGRFSYDLIYLPESDDIYIVAIAHHKRRPGYWRRRL